MDFLSDDFLKTIILSKHKDVKNILIVKKEILSGVIKEGVNYLSEVKQLNLHYKINDSMTLLKDTFIIKDPTEIHFYNLFNKYGIYDKESKIYNRVFKKIREEIVSDEDKVPFAKNYPSIYPQVIVMENLKLQGYKTMDCTKQLDYSHCEQALKKLAYFHALSVKLNEKYPNLINEVKMDYLFTDESNDGPTAQKYKNNFDKFLDVSENIIETNKYVNSLLKIKSSLQSTIRKYLKGNVCDMNVLNHGDYWTNNIMFKHDQNGNIIDAKMVDFQLSRWCSPVVDIWFFVITAMRFEVFNKDFDELLQVYAHTLNKNLESIGMKYSYQDLQNEFKNKALYGLFILIVMVPTLLSGPRGKVVLDRSTKDTKLEFKSFEKSFSSDLYRNLARNWLPVFHEFAAL